MEQSTDDRTTRVTREPANPRRLLAPAMQSTPATLITVRDGHTTTGPVTIVHAPEATPPATITHHCGPDCGRP